MVCEALDLYENFDYAYMWNFVKQRKRRWVHYFSRRALPITYLSVAAHTKCTQRGAATKVFFPFITDV